MRGVLENGECRRGWCTFALCGELGAAGPPSDSPLVLTLMLELLNPLGTALISISALLFCVAQGQVLNQFKRFEYKHSFRTPNLAQRDGSIPFWIVSGDAIASSEQLRLAPSMRSRKGIAWNKRPMVESENWEVDVALKVTGQGRIGADGLAVWYTHLQGTTGPVFGANDYWTGMGLLLDSFDNDGQKNNPYISLMINDGTRSFDHQTDGSLQVLSGCQKDFRNKPWPVRLRIEYLRNVLTISVADGMTQEPRYELCIRAENVFLPKNGYFGVSAATGGLADDHDILDFSVYSLLSEVPKPQTDHQIPQDEKQKYDAEFEQQMKKFEEERKQFKEAHPEKARDDDEYDPAKYFEDVTARELRLIYESQTAIHKVMQQMEMKLQEINQQQHVHTSLLQQGGGAVQQQQQQPAGQQPVSAGGGFLPHEKNEVIQSLRDLTTSIRDMKNYVRTHLENIQNEVRQIRSAQLAQNNPQGQPLGGCENISCVSSTIFLSIIAIQSAVILGFIFMRSKSDKAKFY
ncbi:legume-like lectin family domain-containing protein [Ditylenchus destructor]|uniref:Legume-like lectin family domain-containing protein n=1 Tax=Ditylenchus destructor TaxID=166010 RepID=A0AAD4NEJ6_9BILA|nr:legume-like lectin family domain-containing protein [Ditylenchus destructor]